MKRILGIFVAIVCTLSVFSGDLKIGHDDFYPPWVQVENGQSVGVSVDFAKEIAKRAGFNPIFVGKPWVDVFPELTEKGSVDCIINVGWPNAYFQNFPVVATVPYTKFNSVIFMKNTSGNKITVADLKGKKVVVQKGALGNITEILKKSGINYTEVENDKIGFKMVSDGKADAVITEKLVGKYVSSKFFGGAIKPVSEPIETLEVVFIVKKGNKELLDKLNKTIASLKKAGIITRIYKKWYKSFK